MVKFTAVIVLALVAGCGSQTRTSTGFIVRADPAVAGEPNALRVHDPAASSQTLHAELGMTDMSMPPLRLELRRDDRGDYVADGVQFSMSGPWKITVRDGSRTRSAVLSIRSQ